MSPTFQLVHRLVPFSLGTGLLCGSRPDLTPLLDSRLKFLGQRRVENDDRSGNIERPAFGSDRPTGFGLISYGPSVPTAKFEFCSSIGFPHPQPFYEHLDALLQVSEAVRIDVHDRILLA